MKFNQKVRDKIFERAQGRCELCGSPLTRVQIHHRRPRGMGGTKDEVSGSASNGLAIHPHCHTQVESNRETALNNGWLVPQGIDPETVPVKLWDGWSTLSRTGAVLKSPNPLELSSSQNEESHYDPCTSGPLV